MVVIDDEEEQALVVGLRQHDWPTEVRMDQLETVRSSVIVVHREQVPTLLPSHATIAHLLHLLDRW
jgi:hypothetical protein